MKFELFLRRARRFQRSHVRSSAPHARFSPGSSSKAGTATRVLTYLTVASAERRYRNEAAKYRTRALARRTRWPIALAAVVLVAAICLGLRQNLIAAAFPLPTVQNSARVASRNHPLLEVAAVSTPTLVPTVARPTPVSVTPAPRATATPTINFDIQGGQPMYQVSGVGPLGLFLRPAPNRSGAPIKVLTEGSVVTVLSGDIAGDGWIWNRVRDQNDAEGWVVAQYLTHLASAAASAAGQSAQP